MQKQSFMYVYDNNIKQSALQLMMRRFSVKMSCQHLVLQPPLSFQISQLVTVIVNWKLLVFSRTLKFFVGARNVKTT